MFQHQWRLQPMLAALALVSFIALISPALADTTTDVLPSAQPEPLLSQYVRQHWTTTDGLPHNSVNHISQDHNGYLWLAT